MPFPLIVNQPGNIQSKYRVFFLLAVISFALYFNSLQNAFVLDDEHLIINNSYIKNAKLLPHAFITGIFNFSADKESNYYRPLQTATYALDYAFWKLNPWGYHATNIFLHALNSYLFYLLLIVLFERQPMALAASVLYCIHPVHTSVVAYISGRADILASIFMLLSILNFVEHSNAQRRKSYVLSMVYFFLSLLSRENSILLPLLLLFFYAFAAPKKALYGAGSFLAAQYSAQKGALGLKPGGLLFLKDKKKNEGAFISIASFFIVAGVYAASRLYSIKNLELFWAQDMSGSFFFTLVNCLNVLKKYLLLLLYPWPLYLMRETPFIGNLGLFGGIVFFGIGAAGIYLMRKDKARILAFAFFWLLITLLPLCKLIYFSSTGNALMAESWLYMPSMGFFVILSYFLCEMKIPSRSIFVLLFCWYAGITILTNRNWQNNETLYSHILKFSPRNSVARINLANSYYTQGLYAKSAQLLQGAKGDWYTLLLLGNILLAQGNNDSAAQWYKNSIALNPLCYKAYYNLGITYEKQGKEKEAYAAFLKALEINPEYCMGYVHLGDWLMQRRLYGRAVALYQQALELDPQNEAVKIRIRKATGLNMLYEAHPVNQ